MLVFNKPWTRSDSHRYGRRLISDDKTVQVENNEKIQIGSGLKPSTKRGSEEESSRSDESDDGSVSTSSLGSWRIPVIKQVNFDKDLVRTPSSLERWRIPNTKQEESDREEEEESKFEEHFLAPLNCFRSKENQSVGEQCKRKLKGHEVLQVPLKRSRLSDENFHIPLNFLRTKENHSVREESKRKFEDDEDLHVPLKRSRLTDEKFHIGDALEREPEFEANDTSMKRLNLNDNNINDNDVDHSLTQIPRTGRKKYPTKRCVVCRKYGARRDTRYCCKACKVALCKSPCFKEYHLVL